MSLGARIRAARKHRALTQVLVSEHLDIDQTTLSGWEGGRRSGDPEPATAPEPRASVLVRLAELLDVDPLWLITGANAPQWFVEQEDAA